MHLQSEDRIDSDSEEFRMKILGHVLTKRMPKFSLIVIQDRI